MKLIVALGNCRFVTASRRWRSRESLWKLGVKFLLQSLMPILKNISSTRGCLNLSEEMICKRLVILAPE